MYAFKLLRVRADGTLGSLFINRKAVLRRDTWMTARPQRAPKGFAKRFGWHACIQPHAPHLSKRGRAWYLVELRGVTRQKRPAAQGDVWLTAKRMRIVVKVA